MQFTREARIALRMANFYNETNTRANSAEDTISRMLMVVPMDIITDEERKTLGAASKLLKEIADRTDAVALREAIETRLNNEPEIG